MNEVFLIGKIITPITFKFITNSKKKKSIAKFKFQILDGKIVEIKAYNQTADYIFRKFEKSDNIIINGYLTGKYIIAENIEKM